jgi:hypothetical protein
MSDDTSQAEIVHFPPHEQISEEERNRRIVLEANRLANLSPGERQVWYRGKAEQLGIEPDKLAELVKEKIAAGEKAAAEKLTQEKLSEQRAERKRKTEAQAFRAKVREEDSAAKKTKVKSKAFAEIVKLPADEHDAKLEELSKLIAEDAEALKAEFAEYCAAEIASDATSGFEEAWPDPVTAAQLLEELIACIGRHIIVKPHEVLIIALWILMSWIHEETAHYSPYLVLTSTVPGCGKTTLLKLLGLLTPRPYSFGAATAASVFRVIDREKPTLLGDNVDTLFKRKPDLEEIFLIAHTRGWKIPRAEKINGEWTTRWFDPFCPKALTLIGTDLPEALVDRSIIIELWKMKPGETVAKVSQLDSELMDAFKTFRRKARRWADDHAKTLATAKPTMPAAFIARPADIWVLLWTIADAAGDEWGQLARNAAERLSEEGIVEPSWIERLVQELWTVFVEERHNRIPSKELIKQLTADELSIWHEYGRGHSITQREVAALLRRKLHIHPRGIAIGKRRVKGYYATDFFQKQVFERILGRDPLLRSLSKTMAKPKRAKARKRKAR